MLKMPNAIALSGGIASGKSTLCALLKARGYEVVDTDIIAKKAFNSSRAKIAELFPECVIDGGFDGASGEGGGYGAGSSGAASNFGGGYLSGDLKNGKGCAPRIDRACVGEICFSNKARLGKLERLLHPMILEGVYKEGARLEAKIGLASSALDGSEPRPRPYYFVDIPLLYEGLDIRAPDPMAAAPYAFDTIVLVEASEELRIDRLGARNALDARAARLRLDAQIGTRERKELTASLRAAKRNVLIVANEGSKEELKEGLDLLLARLDDIMLARCDAKEGAKISTSAQETATAISPASATKSPTASTTQSPASASTTARSVSPTASPTSAEETAKGLRQARGEI